MYQTIMQLNIRLAGHLGHHCTSTNQTNSKSGGDSMMRDNATTAWVNVITVEKYPIAPNISWTTGVTLPRLQVHAILPNKHTDDNDGWVSFGHMEVRTTTFRKEAYKSKLLYADFSHWIFRKLITDPPGHFPREHPTLANDTQELISFS